jgi:hypothetical protein
MCVLCFIFDLGIFGISQFNPIASSKQQAACPCLSGFVYHATFFDCPPETPTAAGQLQPGAGAGDPRSRENGPTSQLTLGLLRAIRNFRLCLVVIWHVKKKRARCALSAVWNLNLLCAAVLVLVFKYKAAACVAL